MVNIRVTFGECGCARPRADFSSLLQVHSAGIVATGRAAEQRTLKLLNTLSNDVRGLRVCCLGNDQRMQKIASHRAKC